ncbi:MAG: DUF2339 domain-containing protein [Acidobacteria bacterium]|nr:DUF2339 domain-containing protein [Acidobacteriota bacterium]
MSDLDPTIAALEARLDSLVRTQIDFQVEVTAIRKELSRLRGAQRPESQPFARPQSVTPPSPPQQHQQPSPPPPVTERQNPREADPPAFGSYQRQAKAAEAEPATGKYTRYFNNYVDNARGDLEKFIGENLISKIGIIVLILGVGIGAKYAIDNELVSPLARIVIGYVFGFGLVGLAVWIKVKYLKFSAVLLSGGMAILYFITYFAYSAYQLIDQRTSFALMVMFTIFTVVAAVVYNLQVIAHVGLVGAYAVPFLLSNDSGNYPALFIYVSFLNVGVLAISVKRYWRLLFYTSSFFTWSIFGLWFATEYSSESHLYLALGTLAVFFAIFFATKVIHGVVHTESDTRESLIATVGTTVIFYLFFAGISGLQGTAGEYGVIFASLAVAALALVLVSNKYIGRSLVYVVCPFTWLIFGVWFVDRYSQAEHFLLAGVFASIYFLTFYVTTLISRLATDRTSLPEMAGMMLTNSFIYYGLGYSILDSRVELQRFEGVFTIAHAAFHSVVAQVVSRLKENAVDLVQVLTILIITFATIAVPVQFDGNFVTLIWSVEAALLFYFGRTRQVRFFEYFAYPLMFLAGFSKCIDWVGVYSERGYVAPEFALRPMANGDLVTSLVFVVAFAFIYFANREDNESVLDASMVKPFGYLTAMAGLFALYNAFRMEIGNFFHLEAALRGSTITGIPDIFRFNSVAQIDYTMVFLITVAAVNLQKVRSWIAAVANIALSLVTMIVFLTIGLYLLLSSEKAI